MYGNTRVVVLTTKELEHVIKAVKKQPFDDVDRSALDQLGLALTGGRTFGVFELPANLASEYRDELEQRILQLESGELKDDADNWEAWQATVLHLTAYSQLWPWMLDIVEDITRYFMGTRELTAKQADNVEYCLGILQYILHSGQYPQDNE